MEKKEIKYQTLIFYYGLKWYININIIFKNIVDVQYNVRFRCTAWQFNYIYSFSNYFAL